MAHSQFIGIMACDPNGIVGYKNHMPWHCPEELAFFYEQIADNPIVMGYNTYMTIPKKLHMQRKMVVLTHSDTQILDNTLFLNEIEISRGIIEDFTTHTKLYVIGGAKTIDLFMRHSMIDGFILSIMKQQYIGDTYLNLKYFKDKKWHKIKNHEKFKSYYII